ncbi:hypothetical protein TNCT_24421 [Trichonephila clavata]|uniref:Uncharacterized protein n=1 Tax=Trichonephila clavata TaxID=2740835 RepID=A0A8X6FYF3_TRICU|nr:hypothetical protein TNCT_24421 [Trichonephila clavata]
MAGVMAEMPSVSLNDEKGITSKNVNDIEKLSLNTKSTEGFSEDEHMKKAIIEEIKARILKSLNLTKPPEFPTPVPFLQSFHVGSTSWENQVHKLPDNYSDYNNWESEIVNSEIGKFIF